MTRKIEIEMLRALRHRRAWAKDNTRVVPDYRQDGKPLALVYLHDNHIATLGYGDVNRVVSLSWTMAGWATRTTASRLNAILGEFAEHWERIGFYKFEPELRKRTEPSSEEISANLWYTSEVKS